MQGVPSASVQDAAAMEELLAGLGAGDFDDYEDDAPAAVECATEDDVVLDEPPDPPPMEIPAMVSFATARGGTIAPPSELALSKALKILREVERDVEAEEMPSKRQRVGSPDVQQPTGTLPGDAFNTPARPPVKDSQSGFTLASGSPVPSLSSESRARALAMFEETPVRTATKLQVSVPPTPAEASAEARARVAALFDDAEGAAGSSSGLSSGFQLASGKSAPKPSASSMARALAIFHDDDPATPAAPVVPESPATSRLHTRAESPFPSALRPIRLKALGGSLAQPSTPTRTPLRTTTNTYSNRTSTPQSTKLPKSINISTPGLTPRRIGLGYSSNTRKSNIGFKSPFKSGVPRLGNSMKASELRTPAAATVEAESIWQPVFDLTTAPTQRKGWRDSFLYPQFYSEAYLAELGMPNELWMLSHSNALRYQFIGEDASVLGNRQAFERLTFEGCHLVTQRWVDNHWSLILWKLAGQVLAKPVLFDEKWNWYEVLCQLKYRYEREFGSAQRPIIRRIQEHDSSPGHPMILCVCGVRQPEPVLDDKDEPVPQRPYLILTDGWYRIRATVDDCLARAISKGKIKVGRKLSMSSARLESGADGTDVFEGYDKSNLVLSGNSCHLARWDAKLGVQHLPFVAGLSSLSVDGGVIVMMDVILERVFPLAFMKGERGSRDAPWDEDEEARLSREWKDKYEAESTRLGEEMRKSLEKMEDIVSALASGAEEICAASGSPPDTVEDDWDSLMEAGNSEAMKLIRTFGPSRIVHLAAYARQRLQHAAEEQRSGLEARLKEVCPPREVRDFRIVRLRDAREGRKENMRTAMLNVWDARALGDQLEEGKRYLISNVVPGRQGDWSQPKAGSMKEVYLHTRKDTRWQAVP